MQGDYYSEVFKYVEIKLWKCKKNCTNTTTMNSFLDNQVFNAAFINSYFDFTDFSKYIKTFIDDKLFWNLESQRIKQVNFYVMKSSTQL